MGMTAMRQRFRSAVGCLLCILSMLQCFNLSMFLTACSSEEEQEVPQVPAQTPVVEEMAETAITFSGNEGEEQTVTRAPMTRAGTPLSEKATSFKVWGHKSMDYDEDTGVYSGDQTVFPGYTVNWYSNSAGTTTSNSSNWEYVMPGPPAQTIKFWDWSAAAYRFYAVTGEAAADNDALIADPRKYLPSGSPTTLFKLITNCYDDDGDAIEEEREVIQANMAKTPYFTRLWFSTGKQPEYADKQFGKPVVLEFLKPYARVRFIFKYVFPREGILLDHVSFKPSDGTTPIARKGTVTISYPLTGTAIKESYDTTVDTSAGALTAFTVDYDPEDDGKVYPAPLTEDGWYIVAPNNHQGSYTLSADINAETKTAVVPANYMQWLPGYSYTYIFKILDEGGVKIDLVETAVTTWTPIDVIHEVYNW